MIFAAPDRRLVPSRHYSSMCTGSTFPSFLSTQLGEGTLPPSAPLQAAARPKLAVAEDVNRFPSYMRIKTSRGSSLSYNAL